jgi:hypothetical protein
LQEAYRELAKTVASPKELHSLLMDEVRRRNLGENYENALALKPDGSDFITPLWDPLVSKKTEQLITSLYKKRVTKQKIAGASLVQLSAFGFDDELKVVFEGEGKNKRIKHFEVMMPYWMKDEIGDINELDDKMREMIGYRIPTEDKYSMVPMYVKGFLPKGQGGAVMLPKEITSIAGSDFDIDKLFVMMRSKKTSEKAKRDNEKIDILWKVLTHPSTMPKMLRPGGFDVLKKLAGDMSEIRSNEQQYDFASVLTWSDVTRRNLAGNALVGVFANHNANHAMFQHLGLRFKKLMSFNGRNTNELDAVHQDDLTSSKLATMVAASVDNGKDPVLGTLGVNPYTADMVATIVRMRYSLDTATLFVSQPIIRKLAFRYANEGANPSVEQEIMQELMKETGHSFDGKMYNLSDTDMREAIRQGEADTDFQATVLANFLFYKDNMAQPLADAVQATRADTKGLGPQLSDGEVFKNRQEALETKMIYTREDDSILEGLEKYYPMAIAFQKYGIDFPINDIGHHFPWFNELFTNIKKRIAESKNMQKDVRLTAKELEQVNYHMMTFLASGWDGWQHQHREVILKQLPARLNKMKNKHPESVLLSMLRVRKNQNEDMPSIQLAASGTLSGEEKDFFTREWEDMLNSDDEEMSKFARELADYAFFRNGFIFSGNSFMHLMPVSFRHRKAEGSRESLVEHISKSLRDDNKNLETRFLNQFYRNTLNAPKANYIPIARDGDSGNISELTVHKDQPVAVEVRSEDTDKSPIYKVTKRKEGIFYDWAPYVRYQHNGKWYVLALATQDTETKPSVTYLAVSALGQGNKHWEYNMYGDDRSVFAENQVIPSDKVVQEMESKYSLTPDAAKNDKLNDTLKDFLSNFGITTQAVDKIRTRMGGDAVAVADLARKIIRYTKDGEGALPEEASHFAIELLEDNVFRNRLLELAREHPLYEQVRQDYGQEYTTEEEFAKETAGKLLDQYLKNEHDKAQESLLERIWRKFKSFFKSMFISDIDRQVEAAYGPLAAGIISGDWKYFGAKDEMGGVYYELSQQQKALEKSINTIRKKIETYRKQDKSSFTEREMATLNRLEEKFNDRQYEYGLLDFIESSHEDMKLVQKRIKKLLSQDSKDMTFRDSARTLRVMSDFVNGYKPIIEEIQGIYGIAGITSSSFLDGHQGKVNDIAGYITQIDRLYYDMAVELLADQFEIQFGDRVNWRKALQESDKDITFWQRHLDSMAEADNEVLKAADMMTKEQIRKGQERSYQATRKLLNLQEQAEKDGLDNFDWFYERDSQGRLTGNFVSEYNQHEWKKAKTEFAKELETKDLSEDEYKKAWAIWMSANAVKLNNPFGEGSITLPNDKYKNPEYRQIQEDKTKLKYYQQILDLYREMNSHLPEEDRQKMEYRLPSVRKSSMERMFNTAHKGDFKEIVSIAQDGLVRHEDDTAFGDTDEQGRIVNVVPRYYTGKIGYWTDKDGKRLKRSPDVDLGDIFVDTTDSDMSTDLVRSMALYGDMAYKNGAVREIVDGMEMLKDVVARMEVSKLDSRGKPVMDRVLAKFGIGERVTVSGEETHIYKRLTDYYNMVLYGQQKKDEGRIPGTNINKAKAMDAFGRYVSLSTLAFNVYSGLSNVTLGNAMIRIEAFAKEHVDHEDLMYADKELTAAFRGLFFDFGKRRKTSKAALWYQYMDVGKNHRNDLYGMNNQAKKRLGQILTQDALYFINTTGEFQMQMRMSIALANRVRLEDKDGNNISLWDAMEVKDGELVIRPGLTMNGKPVTDQDIRNFTYKQDFVNKRLHGIYNDVDKSAIQQWGIGRMAIMFRKFIKPGWNRRFAKKQYNYEAQSFQEGNYYSMWNFTRTLMQDLKKMRRFAVSKRFKELSPHEQANIYRTLAEFAYMLSATFLAGVLTEWSDDDDDNYALAMTAYQLNRFYTEMRFFSDPTEAIKILKSPAAGITTATNLIKVVNPFNYFDEIETGKHAGESIGGKALRNAVPLYKTGNRLFDPNYEITYYKR